MAHAGFGDGRDRHRVVRPRRRADRIRWSRSDEGTHRGAFLDAFASWPGGPLAGADALLPRVQGAQPAGCLSNRNSLHWEHNVTRWPILDAFDHRFLSFEFGIVKPDRALFDRVAELLAVPRDRILFLDDNLLNVEGAVAAGFAARHVRGVAEAERALVDAGVIR
jgi:FMN phosphatase YigB (HAD superfamily)